MSINPRRRQPTAASQVRGADTGDLPTIPATAVRHPVNQTEDECGSSPRAPGTCFRKLFNTYTNAFRTSRGVFSA